MADVIAMKKPTPVVAGEPHVDEAVASGQIPVPPEEESEQEAPNIERTPEQQELFNLMAADKKFIAIRQIMECRNKVSEAGAVKEAAISKVHSMIPDDKFSILESRAMALDDKAISELDMSKEEDWQKVLAVYTFEDGSKIHFSNEPDTKDRKCREMHRDFLLYIKKVKVETDKFNEFEKKTKEEIDELYKQLEEVIGEDETKKIQDYATFADYYRDWITEVLKRDDLSDTVRRQLEKTLDADNRGITMDFLKQNLEDVIQRKGSADSIMYGFKNNFVAVGESASKILATKFAKYKYHLSFGKFYDIETRVLGYPEDTKYKNLFMFLLFRFIRHNYEKFDSFWMITIGEILTQLGFLFKSEEERPASSKEFEKNLREILDMVIEH